VDALSWPAARTAVSEVVFACSLPFDPTWRYNSRGLSSLTPRQRQRQRLRTLSGGLRVQRLLHRAGVCRALAFAFNGAIQCFPCDLIPWHAALRCAGQDRRFDCGWCGWARSKSSGTVLTSSQTKPRALKACFSKPRNRTSTGMLHPAVNGHKVSVIVPVSQF
jgi:hypothetical protein